ncbi:MAG: hypothetical protein AB7E83_22040 [Ramlibacter sp.]
MLLVPLGAAVAASPANAQLNVYVQPAVVAQASAPAIERFVLNARGGVEPGREVRFRLVGVPGARVTLDIPGVANNLAMGEARPGVYETEYTVRRRDNPQSFSRAVATLHRAGHRVTAQVDVRGDRWDDRRDNRDNRGPDIAAVTPSQGERVSERGRTRISARFSDDRSGIDMASVQLRLNGRDVTRFSRFDNDEIQYREDLGTGRHTAELTVRDKAGNTTRRSWSFDVVDPDRRHGYGSGAQVIGQRW